MTYKTCVRRKTMHKFFCNYNSLTEKYELSLNRNMLFSPRINVMAENTLLPEIKKLLQEIYDNILLLKENITNEEQLKTLDNNELLLSNLYYSLFASPLELNSPSQMQGTIKDILSNTIGKVSSLIEKINIPEYNRLASLMLNNFQNILNSIS